LNTFETSLSVIYKSIIANIIYFPRLIYVLWSRIYLCEDLDINSYEKFLEEDVKKAKLNEL